MNTKSYSRFLPGSICRATGRACTLIYMNGYDEIRQKYKPERVKILLIAESPPPDADVQSSRHFYRSDRTRKDDRLFTNTIKALYEEAAELTEVQIQTEKKKWLKRL